MNTSHPPTLTIRDSRSGLHFCIEPGQRVVLGRDPSCDVVLPVPALRKLAAFENVEGRCFAELLSITRCSAMFLAGQRVHGTVEVPVGEKLKISELVLTVEPVEARET